MSSKMTENEVDEFVCHHCMLCHHYAYLEENIEQCAVLQALQEGDCPEMISTSGGVSSCRMEITALNTTPQVICGVLDVARDEEVDHVVEFLRGTYHWDRVVATEAKNTRRKP